MSQENVERLRLAYSALAEGDVAPILELCGEDIEVTEPQEIPDSASFRGHSGVLAVLEKLRAVFPDLVFEPYDFAARGDQAVLVSIRWRGTGASSGTAVASNLFHVWTFSGRAAIRIQAYFDHSQALEAAGLSE